MCRPSSRSRIPVTAAECACTLLVIPQDRMSQSTREEQPWSLPDARKVSPFKFLTEERQQMEA